jgi:hypothetical protein
MSDEQWFQRYVFTELQESLFGEFLIILIEWLEILVENNGRYRIVEPRDWTPELVRKLNYVSNTTSCIVNFWLNNILGCYIKEFAVDCTQSNNVTERDLFKGLCERFMKALGTWINILLCDKCAMTI